MKPRSHKAYAGLTESENMRRRSLLAGIVGSLSLSAGCAGSSPSDSGNSPRSNQTSSQPTKPRTRQTTTEGTDTTSAPTESATERPISPTISQRERADACNGGIYLDFYALDDTADQMWDPDTVRVAFGVGPGAQVRLVVFEDDTVLGMNQAFAPEDSAMDDDGLPIDLNKKLSGEHTIRAVMYPRIGMKEQFDAKEATPCQYEGKPVQTEPTTIDFSEFSEGTPTP